MITRTKMIPAVLAASALTAALSVTTAGPALASGGSCASGYNFLDSYKLTNNVENEIGGYLSLYYNPSTGKNCAITRAKAAWDGKASQIYVSLSDGDAHIVRDPSLSSNANYHYYAGPVYLALKNKCAYIHGSLHYGGDVYYTRVDTGVHCG
ncbi:hypothetical protein J4573_39285 [Actinomadura barringtoniae]|uniref:Spore-associated protein A n=1 Tax=Actinomadura barringtoniae TaxID=1427535 RepID=A0A939PHW4_9ACTN|nr:hypothetical protein [Actinomadura barringtoniae]MBO2453192.1 hypothetical protein [Actinomadura barringtoniae]